MALQRKQFYIFGWAGKLSPQHHPRQKRVGIAGLVALCGRVFAPSFPQVWLSAWQFVLCKRGHWKKRINIEASDEDKRWRCLFWHRGSCFKNKGGENTKQKTVKNKIVGSQLKGGSFEVKVDIRGILSRSSERRWWHGKPFVTDLLGSSLLGSTLLGRLKLLVPVVKTDKT